MSWLSEIKKRWPDVKFITQGEFGLIWREHYKTNNFNYRFEEKGSGIGDSDADKEIRWFMNKKFRLALLLDLKSNTEKVIDFTRYDLKAKDSMLICKTFIIFVFTIPKNGFKPVRKGLQLRVAALYFSSIVGQTFLLFSKAHTQAPKFSFAQLPLLSF